MMIETIAVLALIIVEILAVIGGFALYKLWKAPASYKYPHFWIAFGCYIVGISGLIFEILTIL